MFGNRYFAPRYFPDRYYPPGSTAVVPPMVQSGGVFFSPRAIRGRVYVTAPPVTVAIIGSTIAPIVARPAVVTYATVAVLAHSELPVSNRIAMEDELLLLGIL